MVQGNFKVQLISKNGDIREIEARAYQKQIGNVQNNRLFIFDFPPTVRGTGLLLHSFFDDRPNNMWIYLPAVRRVKRIALESSGGGYFMGSDFTYTDLINNDVSEMSFEMLPETTINGVECYTLKAWGKTAEIKQEMGYSFMISYHRKDNYMIYKREYYDFNEELLKVYLADEYLTLGTAVLSPQNHHGKCFRQDINPLLPLKMPAQKIFPICILPPDIFRIIRSFHEKTNISNFNTMSVYSWFRS
jgi:hypothetical protein